MHCIVLTQIFAGRYAGDFIEIGSGVRSLGLSGAFTAIADDGSAIYWNASGISQIKRIELGLMRAFLYQGLANYDHITYCQPLPNDVTIGANWTRLTIPNIPYFDEKHLIGSTVDKRVSLPELNLTGIPDDKFNSIDDLFQFAFSKHINYNLDLGWVFFDLPIDIHIGGNIKYISRRIYNYTGIGTGFDLSMLIKNDLSKWFDVKSLGQFNFGLNFQDIGGTSITWDTVSRNTDEVLLNTKLGLSFKQPLNFINSSVLIATDTDFHAYGQKQHYGIEYRYADLLAARAGYFNNDYSAGLSVMVFDLSLDYAFVTNNLGNTHRVGLRAFFN